MRNGDGRLKTPERAVEDGGLPPQAGRADRPIAAFDFDGTLTSRDSFEAFLRWRTSLARWVVGLVRLAPDALAYLIHRDRGRLKSAAVRVFLAGTPRSTLELEADRFAAEMAPRLFRPDALRAWAEHGERGDLRVIVTASPEAVVAPFAKRLGADVLIGSRLVWGGDNRVGSGLKGPNCRGPEKVSRLRERFGYDVRIADAYGDTAGDDDMLAVAARGHMRRFVGRP